MKYYNRLRQLRKEKGLKQQDIADILSVNESTYGRYENGKRQLHIEDLEKLCKFYNVSADYILGFTEKREIKWNEQISKNINIIQNRNNINNIKID